jgi:two-component system sensor histidine kinase VanS
LAKTESGVKICIQNKGQTIPPEKLKRIFEQFYRLDAARSGDTGGAGLGLAIAKEIVELHHGTIAASSADETIRFEILLPNDCQKIV